ncbi:MULTISPECIES: DUF1152 domain-containing protein [Metallosphaera]|uniref:DUF1152 domain-containing protein n=3 Tax=Metallosphaera TaxID=41980 RepID=A4YEI7_METS5|nr:MULTISPECIES: DUF1152 domain-containing protein [Metallosphaera]ABP94839.1 protein of unknown function DUF1152 [Metallosphaera sedula DSM 5348]AIM26826.1 protein of unknown function DUF1152 [Metallosphaera sedula]MCY0860812.1 DUF1152 domain-containing protein [Metallosphaera prunae]QCO29633.1 DUF1152 domain-containing protein [Metallosphaera prunae]WPX06871.1 DUF1152 domain-containing protein [Metallosphaera sedula DSM 5348]
MNSLVLGAGGGGDVVSALLPYERIRRRGERVTLGAVLWERRVEDPVPGPICTNDLREAQVINERVAILGPNSFAVRGGRKVKPQAARVAQVLGINVVSFCISGGVSGLYRDIMEIANMLGIDQVIGVDAGGDILAEGTENNLLSPLADSITLALLSKLEESSMNVQLSVIGLGADGELKPDYLLQRISKIASLNGLIEILGFDESSASVIERVLEVTVTEASALPLKAFRGLYGEVPIRNGKRRVFVSPLTSVMFSFKPIVVASISKLYEAVRDSSSLEEANEALHRLGLITELDRERGLKDE